MYDEAGKRARDSETKEEKEKKTHTAESRPFQYNKNVFGLAFFFSFPVCARISNEFHFVIRQSTRWNFGFFFLFECCVCVYFFCCCCSVCFFFLASASTHLVFSVPFIFLSLRCVCVFFIHPFPFVRLCIHDYGRDVSFFSLSILILSFDVDAWRWRVHWRDTSYQPRKNRSTLFFFFFSFVLSISVCVFLLRWTVRFYVIVFFISL